MKSHFTLFLLFCIYMNINMFSTLYFQYQPVMEIQHHLEQSQEHLNLLAIPRC